MTEQEETARLWECFPKLLVDVIYDHGVKRFMVDEVLLNDHTCRLALYFFRGGVAHQWNKEGENNG